MYHKIVQLDNSDQIIVEWENDVSNMTIQKDGTLIGTFIDKEDAKLGRRFTLPDGCEFTVVYSQFGLEVWQNGVELVSGGKSSYADGFGYAAKWLFWLGIARLIFAPILFFTKIRTSEIDAWAAALGNGVSGGIFLGLGLWAKKTGSKMPFWIGIVFAGLQIVLILLSGEFLGIILLGVLIYYLYQGIQADAPIRKRKPSHSANAPLDSDL
jgi:hypothetical protein